MPRGVLPTGRATGLLGRLPAVLCQGVALLTLSGCGTERPTLAAGNAPLAGQDSHPVRTAGTGSESGSTATVQRLQKPDADASVLQAGAQLFPGDPGGDVAGRIRAHVNGAPILDHEVREAVYSFLAQLPPAERAARLKEADKLALQQLIDREVILSEALARLKQLRPHILEKFKEAATRDFEKQVRSLKERSKVQTDDELKAVLKSGGMSLDSLRRQAERNFMAAEYMRSRIFPTVERIGHEQIREYYDEHAAEFQVDDRVEWQDIFLDAGSYPGRDAARQLAEQLVYRARQGQDFLKLAEQYDSYRGGVGLGRKRGEIKPAEAEPALFGMRDGEVAVVAVPTGYHVIRLVKRTHAGRLPFDEATQAEIRKKLQMVVWGREYKSILADMKRKAAIEVAP